MGDFKKYLGEEQRKTIVLYLKQLNKRKNFTKCWQIGNIM